MSRPSFEALVVFCDTHKLPDSAIFPHRSIQPVPMNEMLSITLWYLANQCTHREISVLFDRSISMVWRSVNNITKIIERHLQNFIKWPTAKEFPAGYCRKLSTHCRISWRNRSYGWDTYRNCYTV
jgi:hypothetical protein